MSFLIVLEFGKKSIKSTNFLKVEMCVDRCIRLKILKIYALEIKNYVKNNTKK